MIHDHLKNSLRSGSWLMNRCGQGSWQLLQEQEEHTYTYVLGTLSAILH